jgi:hypothetical protein
MPLGRLASRDLYTPALEKVVASLLFKTKLSTPVSCHHDLMKLFLDDPQFCTVFMYLYFVLGYSPSALLNK